MENAEKIKEIIKELKCINNEKKGINNEKTMSNLGSVIYQLENAVDVMQGNSKSMYDLLMEYTFLG